MAFHLSPLMLLTWQVRACVLLFMSLCKHQALHSKISFMLMLVLLRGLRRKKEFLAGRLLPCVKFGVDRLGLPPTSR